MREGDDVTLCYGDFANAALMLEYGFRVPGNTRGAVTSPFTGDNTPNPKP